MSAKKAHHVGMADLFGHGAKLQTKLPRERHPRKLQELAEELELAFDARDENREPQPTRVRRQQSA
jgi:hypothetical protein